jgi:hypothetical protein
VPDQKHEVVTSGLREFNGLDYLAAALTSDGNTMIAYMPTRRAITVDLKRLSGKQVHGWWFNPRDGTATSIGYFPTGAVQQFRPPSEGDWALVLDNADTKLDAPGQQRTVSALFLKTSL